MARSAPYSSDPSHHGVVAFGNTGLIGFGSGPPNGMFPAIRISCSTGPSGVFDQVMPGGSGTRTSCLAERVAAVIDPVVHLELDPRRGEQVQ